MGCGRPGPYRRTSSPTGGLDQSPAEVGGVPPEPVAIVELVEDWLTAKRALEPAAQATKGNSDRARRSDLGRWALVIGEAYCRPPPYDQPLSRRSP